MTLAPPRPKTLPNPKMPRKPKKDTKAYCVAADASTRTILRTIKDKLIKDKLGKTAQDIVRMILEDVDKREITIAELRDFYVNVWLRTARTIGDQRSKLVRYNWTERQNQALEKVAERVFTPLDPLKEQPQRNKSQAYRMLVTYYAIKHNYVTVKWTPVASFSPKKPKGAAGS